MRPYQTRLESLVEVVLNIALGFVVSYLVWLYVVPVFWPQHRSNPAEALGITTLFTTTSVARSYVVRRFFERHLHRLAHAITKGIA